MLSTIMYNYIKQTSVKEQEFQQKKLNEFPNKYINIYILAVSPLRGGPARTLKPRSNAIACI